MDLLIACVPNKESLALKGGEVVNAGEEKRVEVLGGVGSWNEPSWQNIPLLVAVTRGEIVDDPDIYPAIRLLVSVKLCSIRREHEDSVVRFKMLCDVCTVILALSIVGEGIGRLDLAKEDVRNLLSITHLLCAEPMAPQRLDLWSNGDGCHRLSRFVGFPFTRPKGDWVVTRLVAFAAGIEILVRTSKRHARVDAHIIVNWGDPG